MNAPLLHFAPLYALSLHQSTTSTPMTPVGTLLATMATAPRVRMARRPAQLVQEVMGPSLVETSSHLQVTAGDSRDGSAPSRKKICGAARTTRSASGDRENQESRDGRTRDRMTETKSERGPTDRTSAQRDRRTPEGATAWARHERPSPQAGKDDRRTFPKRVLSAPARGSSSSPVATPATLLKSSSRDTPSTWRSSTRGPGSQRA